MRRRWRLFQGVRRGPLSESLYGRIWHQARAAAMPEDGPGTQPVRRSYDLRHAALSLWLASVAAPAEIAARAGHSVRVLLTIYAHCMPVATRSPASRLSKPSAPAGGPPLAHKNRRRRRESCPSCVRATAGLNGTQLDPKPPARSGYMFLTCGNADPRGLARGSRPRTDGPGHPFTISR
jgi:hypothetical protein